MFAILAFVAAILGFLLNGLAAHTNAWFSPISLSLASLAFLALHLAGFGAQVGTWLRR